MAFKLNDATGTGIAIGKVDPTAMIEVNSIEVMKITPEGEIKLALKDDTGETRMIPLQEIYDSLDLIKDVVIKEIKRRF